MSGLLSKLADWRPEKLLGQEVLFWGIDLRFVVYALVFLGVLLALEGLRQLLRRGETGAEARNRRMQMLVEGKSSDEILALLKPREAEGWITRVPFAGNLPVALRTAGITLAPKVFLALLGAAFVVAATLGAHAWDPVSAFAGAFGVTVLLPLAWLGGVQRKRIEKLAMQLPDALDLMARGLRVGHPIATTLQSVADEMPDPIGTEFGVVVDQVAYGATLTEAMRELAERISQEDVTYLSIAVGIQHGTGGDLSKVLRTLANVIRARIALRRKVKALSAEGRMTAMILSSLPILIAGVMTVTAPEYYGGVVGEPMFLPVMAAIVTAFVVAISILFRVVNFRY